MLPKWICGRLAPLDFGSSLRDISSFFFSQRRASAFGLGEPRLERILIRRAKEPPDRPQQPIEPAKSDRPRMSHDAPWNSGRRSGTPVRGAASASPGPGVVAAPELAGRRCPSLGRYCDAAAPGQGCANGRGYQGRGGDVKTPQIDDENANSDHVL